MFYENCALNCIRRIRRLQQTKNLIIVNIWNENSIFINLKATEVNK